jgi:hypothetical protein
MTPQGQAAAPAQQPGWFSRNWKWLIPVGCGLPLLCCGVFGIGTYFTVSKVIQGTPVFAEAIEKANTNPEVTAALGQPVTPGFMLSGEVKESGGGGGTANFTIPLEGPKGKGSLEVNASRVGGTWTFNSLKASVGGGKVVDLLAGEAAKHKPDDELPAPPGGKPDAPGSATGAVPPEDDAAPPPEGDDPE